MGVMMQMWLYSRIPLTIKKTTVMGRKVGEIIFQMMGFLSLRYKDGEGQGEGWKGPRGGGER